MPFLATVLLTSFLSVVAFFSQFLTKRLTLVAAFVLLVSVATLAFIVVIEGLIASVEVVLPAAYYVGVGLFLPPNFTVCLTAIVTAKLAAWAYVWNIKVIQYKLDF